MQFLYGYKTYMGGMALMLMAVGNVLQGTADGTEVDLDRAINDFIVGASIFGAAYRAGRSGQ